MCPLDAEVIKVKREARAGPMDRRAKERHYIDCAEAICARLVRQHRLQPFDFIYERYALWSAAGVRAARRLGIPFLVEVNAPLLIEQQKYRKLALTAEAAAIEADDFRGADALLAVSRQVRDYAVAKGADSAFLPENSSRLDSFDSSI